MLITKKRIKEPVQETVRSFYEKRNKVVIIRASRGIGDILTCRMLFKNFKKVMPEINLAFACYKPYMELIDKHPYLDEVVNISDLDKNNYMLSYNISTCCIHYESKVGINNKKHRAEIWAEHCGVPLEDTDMHLPFISSEFITNGTITLKQLRKASLQIDNKDGPSVLLCPYAYESLRSLDEKQIVDLVKILKSRGLFVYSTHTHNISALNYLKVPILRGNTYADWMGYIHAADYVVSVDTSAFHYAGGIKKPLVGIFTHVDGKLRGKFYDFVLVQKHKDNGNWPCGPCYNYLRCTNSRCTDRSINGSRPCKTELNSAEMEEGIEKMLKKWPI